MTDAPQNSASPSEPPLSAAQIARRRKDRLVKLGFLAVLLVAGAIVLGIQMRGPKLLGWGDDLNAALQQAAAENRPVLAYFVDSTSGDMYRRMARGTLTRPGNKAAMEHIGFIRVLVRDMNAAEKYGIKEPMTLAVISPQGVRCPTAKEYRGQFIGEQSFREEFLEPRLEGWRSSLEKGFDFEALRTAARGADKPLLVLFTAAGSDSKVRRLAYTVLPDPGVAEALNGVDKLVVPLHEKSQASHVELAQTLKVESFPALVLLAPDGTQRELKDLPADKAVTAAEFMTFLKGK